MDNVDLPWLAWNIGDRVVIRRRENDGLYDALGELIESTPHSVTINTRRGQVRISAEKMVTGKLVTPATKPLPESKPAPMDQD